ncbi:hypothetical protein ANN_00589 [Periplaneta americana]|uniref:G-protein coupled receptors family 1 profile domain-containing protein n=1 Tax=Periplaneta americana TaxID=6978 RepID=A0ABQ8TU19_PERAM|nr:hypothetical protein ANN_00589 [Periplaneta americana]
MLGENPQTIRENTGILLEAGKEIGLEVNSENTKYMIMSRDENIVRNGNIKIGNLSFEEVEKFKYLGATVTNINDTREEIKHRINMGNACYYSVEQILSSSLLSKNVKIRIYKTVILPVVLYGCETWTLALREEHRLRVFENKVLRKIFGAKRDEVTGEWRKLHNAELHALYSSPDIIRNIKSRCLRWAGHAARMGESRNAYRVLVGRPRRKWEDNIKMDLRDVGYDDREWINLSQDRDQWRAYLRAAMNLRKLGEVIVGKRRIKCINFADDMALLAEKEKILRNMILELNDNFAAVWDGNEYKRNETKGVEVCRIRKSKDKDCKVLLSSSRNHERLAKDGDMKSYRRMLHTTERDRLAAGCMNGSAASEIQQRLATACGQDLHHGFWYVVHHPQHYTRRSVVVSTRCNVQKVSGDVPCVQCTAGRGRELIPGTEHLEACRPLLLSGPPAPPALAGTVPFSCKTFSDRKLLYCESAAGSVKVSGQRFQFVVQRTILLCVDASVVTSLKPPVVLSSVYPLAATSGALCSPRINLTLSSVVTAIVRTSSGIAEILQEETTPCDIVASESTSNINSGNLGSFIDEISHQAYSYNLDTKKGFEVLNKAKVLTTLEINGHVIVLRSNTDVILNVSGAIELYFNTGYLNKFINSVSNSVNKDMTLGEKWKYLPNKVIQSINAIARFITHKNNHEVLLTLSEFIQQEKMRKTQTTDAEEILEQTKKITFNLKCLQSYVGTKNNSVYQVVQYNASSAVTQVLAHVIILSVGNKTDIIVKYREGNAENLIWITSSEMELKHILLMTSDIVANSKVKNEANWGKEVITVMRNVVDPIIFSLIFSVGILGNSILILIFIRYKSKRTMINIMIINLAISDILNLSINGPLHLFFHFHFNFEDGYAKHETACRTVNAIREYLKLNSALAVIFLMAQRCIVILPDFNKQKMSVNSIVMCLAAVWIFPAFIAFGHAFFPKFYEPICYMTKRQNLKESYIPVFSSVLYVLILPSMMFVLSFLLARKISRKDNNISKMKEEERKRSARVLMSLAVIFVITNCPFHTWVMIRWIGFDETYASMLISLYITKYLLFANGCFNPIALFITSSDFKESLTSDLCSQKPEVYITKL